VAGFPIYTSGWTARTSVPPGYMKHHIPSLQSHGTHGPLFQPGMMKSSRIRSFTITGIPDQQDQDTCQRIAQLPGRTEQVLHLGSSPIRIMAGSRRSSIDSPEANTSGEWLAMIRCTPISAWRSCAIPSNAGRIARCHFGGDGHLLIFTG